MLMEGWVQVLFLKFPALNLRGRPSQMDTDDRAFQVDRKV